MESNWELGMKGAVFLNGFYDMRYPEFYAEVCETPGVYLVCADGGLSLFRRLKETLETNFCPDWVVGDFDSLDAEERRFWESQSVRFNPVWDGKTDKDFTDGQLALSASLDAGCRDITIHGALPRPDAYDHDHFLANLFLLSDVGAHGRPPLRPNIRISEPFEAIYWCDSRLRISRVGEGLNRVSLLPLQGEVRIRESRGLRWDLAGFAVRGANALRNEILSDAPDAEIVLDADSPSVFVIHNWYQKAENSWQ